MCGARQNAPSKTGFASSLACTYAVAMRANSAPTAFFPVAHKRRCIRLRKSNELAKSKMESNFCKRCWKNKNTRAGVVCLNSIAQQDRARVIWIFAMFAAGCECPSGSRRSWGQSHSLPMHARTDEFSSTKPQKIALRHLENSVFRSALILVCIILI